MSSRGQRSASPVAQSATQNRLFHGEVRGTLPGGVLPHCGAGVWRNDGAIWRKEHLQLQEAEEANRRWNEDLRSRRGEKWLLVCFRAWPPKRKEDRGVRARQLRQAWACLPSCLLRQPVHQCGTLQDAAWAAHLRMRHCACESWSSSRTDREGMQVCPSWYVEVEDGSSPTSCCWVAGYRPHYHALQFSPASAGGDLATGKRKTSATKSPCPILRRGLQQVHGSSRPGRCIEGKLHSPADIQEVVAPSLLLHYGCCHVQCVHSAWAALWPSDEPPRVHGASVPGAHWRLHWRLAASSCRQACPGESCITTSYPHSRQSLAMWINKRPLCGVLRQGRTTKYSRMSCEQCGVHLHPECFKVWHLKWICHESAAELSDMLCHIVTPVIFAY